MILLSFLFLLFSHVRCSHSPENSNIQQHQPDFNPPNIHQSTKAGLWAYLDNFMIKPGFLVTQRYMIFML